MKIKKILPDIIAIIAFVLLSFAYFFPADIEGRVLFQHDTAAGAGAGQEAKEYHEATGKTTRWTDALFGGMPTYQIAPSYKSTEPVRMVEKAYRLFLPDYVCLVFILILGFYILMRAFGMSVWLSALGGLIWAFSSYFFILISAGHIWKFITLAYIPPTIAGMVLAYRGKYLAGGVVTALFVTLQIMSNHVQMSYYFLFVMLFIAVGYFVKAYQEKQLKGFFKATGVLIIAGIIGVMANISNLYHTYTYSKETMRGKSELVSADKGNSAQTKGLDRDYITQWSYGKAETLTLLIPNFKGGASVPLSENETAMSKADLKYAGLYQQFGQYFGDQPMTAGPVYVGAFVLFLFLLGCFIVKGPFKWAMVAATVFSIALAWGKNFMPVTDFFIDYIPMYNKFRAVSSILVIAEFSIPVLAILALKEVICRPSLLKEEKKAVGISTLFTLGLALLVALAPSALESSFVSQQESMMLNNAVAQQMIPAAEMGGIMASLTAMREAMVVSDAWRSVIILLIGGGLLALFYYKKVNKQVLIGGIIVLCTVDLWTVNKRYLNDGQFVDRDIMTTTFNKTKTDELLLQDKDPDFRVLNLASNTFNENNTSYWHKSVGGYHAAKLRRYQEMIDHHIEPEMQAAYQEIAKANGRMDSVDASKFRVLNMLNTKYFILPVDRQGNTLPLHNPYAYGNAWFVRNVEYVANANEEIDALHSADPKYTAVVDKRFEGDLHKLTEAAVDSTASVRLLKYEPNHLVYESSNDKDGVAVFSEIYYADGWKATVDGKPAPIGRADYILRALYLPAGKHRIEMTFDPQSIHITEGIACAAIAILFIGAVAALILSVKRTKKEEKTTTK